MKIGFISQWYEPEPGAAAHPTAIAKALSHRGHDVKVLTGYPNYPLGRVYPEYKMRLRQFERIDGIDIVRVPLVPNHDASAPKRALALGSFALSASTQVVRLRDVDVCFVYLTPATVGLAARLLKRVTGVPYVLYVQDLWPESVTASGFISNVAVERWVESRINSFCAGLYAGAESVVAISPTMADQLRERGVDDHQSHVIYNWVDESVFRPVRRLRPDERTVLDPGAVWMMYAGGIGEVQGLDTAVRALALLRDRPNIKLALVGEGVAVDALRALAHALDVSDRVHYLGGRPMSEMPALMAEADAQLICLRDLPVFRGTVPSKTQSAMATSLPIVCSVPGDAAKLVHDAGAGFTAAPEDDGQLADAILAVSQLTESEKDEMGAAGRRFYDTQLSQSVGVEKFDRLLARAARAVRSR